MSNNHASLRIFDKVMDKTGFYRNGHPTNGVLPSDQLLQIEKQIKYGAVVDKNKIDVTAIFELSSSSELFSCPCIYFKRLEQADPPQSELKKIHKMIWNHGLAPLFWIITPNKVSIYNSFSKPTNIVDISRHLIKEFDCTDEGLDRLNEFAGRHQFDSGAFWRTRESQSINKGERVDESLLADLKSAENELKGGGLNTHVAHSLLGRSIFISFLCDRGILREDFFQGHFNSKNFVDLLGDKKACYSLFSEIQRTFNGDLFPVTDSEYDQIRSKHLSIVNRLLLGEDMKTGQMSLWPYNFSIIPVELISSIYEMFSHSMDARKAEELSTHYTPSNLVDLIFSQIFDGLSPGASVLDISCGSGVFLVEALRRLFIARISKGERKNRKLIREILKKQVFGVDINRSAIEIAAFSLYLTALELDPNPEPLDDLRFEPLINKNLFVSHSLNEKESFNQLEPFRSKSFGVIVGNPPWTRTKDDITNAYCEKNNVPRARNSIDQAFLWRVGDFANDKTRIGLILNSKPFFAHTKKATLARKAIFERYKASVLINLSNLRQENLFPKSTAPAMVFISEGRRSSRNDTFIIASPERSAGFQRNGIIEIMPERIRRLSAAKVAAEDDLLKIAVWGGPRDLELIKRLERNFISLQMFCKDNGWNFGQGYQTANGNKRMPDYLYGAPWLQSGELTKFSIDTESLPKLPSSKTFLSPRDPKIYHGPLVIATRGLGQAGFFSAFSENTLVYTEEYFGISAPKSDVNLLYYINAILNSQVAKYFLFLTGSVWGVERDKVEPNDLKRLPIPRPERSNQNLITKLLNIEHSISETIRREEPYDHLVNELERVVYSLYGLSSNDRVLIRDLIEYTIDRGPNASGTTAVPDYEVLKAYAFKVISVIQPFLDTLQERRILAEVYAPHSGPFSIVKFRIVSNSSEPRKTVVQNTSIHGGFDGFLSSLSSKLRQKITDQVYTHRIALIYGVNELFIVKPFNIRHWLESTALNDADTILKENWGLLEQNTLLTNAHSTS
jgi:hypothetical protein